MLTNGRGDARPFLVASTPALGAAIRHYRRQSGLTQAELARRAGLPRETLSRLENGHETEQLRHIFALLRQLGVGVTLEPVPADEWSL